MKETKAAPQTFIRFAQKQSLSRFHAKGLLVLGGFVTVAFAPTVANGQLAHGQSEATDDSMASVDETNRTLPVAPLAPRPIEPPAPRFGDIGEFVVTGFASIDVSSVQYQSQASFFSADFSPGLDYFFVRNLSVGIDLEAQYSDGRGYGADSSLVESKSTTIRAAPRLGWNIPVTRSFSVYPAVRVGFESIVNSESVVSGSSPSIAGSALGYPSTTQTGPWVAVFAPVLYHVVPRAFIGLGPYLFRDFGDVRGGPNVGGQRTTWGPEVVVGGFFGGTPPVEAAQPPPTSDEASADDVAAHSHRFGEAHEFVITGETNVSAYWTAYAGSGSSRNTVTFSPGVDYFVANRFSLGVGAVISSNNISGIDPSTRAIVSENVGSAGVTFRLGFDVPMGQWLSLYARAALSVGRNSYDERSNGLSDTYNESYSSIGVYAPLLVHPAPHVFVGFGPSVSRDLDRTDTFPQGGNATNPSTSLGASLIVGVWLH
jgi:hypothetical protein